MHEPRTLGRPDVQRSRRLSLARIVRGASIAAVLAITWFLSGAGGLAGDSAGRAGGAAVAHPDDSTRPAAVWRSARATVAGTYLPDMIAAGHSHLKRWPDRREAPIRVWIEPGDSVPGWQPAFDDTVRAAFVSWERIGLPVRFAFTPTPDGSEVRVSWTERLPARNSGIIRWRGDGEGWLTEATIELATEVSDGTSANLASVWRIALHEIGHLLGLEHSTDAGDVMAPWVVTGRLSARDEATARLLYALPVGEVPTEPMDATS